MSRRGGGKGGLPPKDRWADIVEMLDAAPVFVFALDRQGIVTVAAGKGLEGDGEDLVGTWIGDLFLDAADLTRAVDQIMARESFDGHALQKGRVYHVKTLALADPIDGGALYIGIAVDATDRVDEATAERSRFRRNARRTQAEEQVAFRSAILELINHEIRTPITPLLIHLHLLRQGDEDRLSDQQRASLKAIKNNLGRLMEVLEEGSLRLGEGLNGGVENRVDLRAVVKQTLKDLDDRIDRTGVILDVQTPSPVHVTGTMHRVEVLLTMVLELIVNHNGTGDLVRLNVAEEAGSGCIVIRNARWAPSDQEMVRIAAPDFFETLSGGAPGHPDLFALGIARAMIEEEGGDIAVRVQADPPHCDVILRLPLAA